jgi:hypothetical protein
MLRLIHELVTAVSGRVDLWLRARELRRLQREFPPRFAPFWPMMAILALGLGAMALSAMRVCRVSPVRHRYAAEYRKPAP